LYTKAPYGADIRVDGKPAENLGPQEYACMSLPSGDHVLSVDKEKLALRAEPRRDYFIRIQGYGEGETFRRMLDITDTYEIGRHQSLAPRKLRKSVATDCRR
jgi:hypothetical protein